MKRATFLAQRKPAWQNFEKSLRRVESVNQRRLSSEEVLAFSRQLREVAHDLEQVRTRDWGLDLEEYLNRLLARGHDYFHAPRAGTWHTIGQFLFMEFPRIFRTWWGYQLLAALLFFGPLIISWILIQNEPALAARFMSQEALDQYDMMYSSEDSASIDESAFSFDSWNDYGNERASMAGFYVQHNVGIALQCFARGILLGIGTIYTLLFNGISIGATAGYVLSLGHADRFLGFVVSHGSFELTAIAIAGGAGLLVGDAALHPGQLSRWSALRLRGRDAGQLAVGAAFMLVVAALIEAFWSPAPIPSEYKFLVGGFLWFSVAMYLGWSGRQRA
ncbi:hypothetical protein Spb1_02450 [Planctopirus ephydatiae]|uniref:Stage II sporulation protein M n=1 Tax=Planctopirus ephydatiae TaxID=2528019 RepID=A0A518GIH8_9PLAN|nr:stage II sporulation protein M [Planctopirus ephydatiae]QDV28382.1 hypothetical protein Spb1_02450 [Planctopirus ephydatiae]